MRGDAGIIYFNVGTKCLARMLVSLWSLRKHYKGGITILNVPSEEQCGIVHSIASDERISADIQPIKIKQLRRNTAYVAKSGLWRYSPYKVTLFLDSDTIVVGDVLPLLAAAADESRPGWVLTQFSDWVTTGDIVGGRIRKWFGVKALANSDRFEKLIDGGRLAVASLTTPFPAINTGVFAHRSDRKTERILRDWERLTHAGEKCPFTDELAAQILLRMHPHAIVDDRWNFSPIYGKHRAEAVVWHAHGDKHLMRPDGRGSEGHLLWWPIFRQAWEANAGRVREWAPAGDDALAAHLPALG